MPVFREANSWLDCRMATLVLKRLSAVGCAALLAATMTHATDTKTDSDTATKQPAPNSQTHSTSKKTKKSRKSTSRRPKGQQKIDPQRALEIQQALIREHYLTGKPSGVWNEATQQAMQRYQADNNWQSKTTPDARALIKLGLGPDHQHLLNPESAMTGQPNAANGVSDKQQK